MIPASHRIPWNPAKKPHSFPNPPASICSRTPAEKSFTSAKPASLRSRVRSYFLESRWVDAKTGSLAREIADLETIVVDNEREALALENNLIKQYKPKFNILLRDDKTYPYIKLTVYEKYPRVYFTRRVKKDGSLYFGPYFPASLARRILHFIHKRFLVPSCYRGSDKKPSAPLPAVLHSPLPRPVRHRPDHRRALCRSRARRAHVSRRPPPGPDEKHRGTHAGRAGKRAIRTSRLVSRSASHARRHRGAPAHRLPRRATTPMCLPITPNLRWSPPISSTCAAAASWIAANFTGRISTSSIPTNLSRRC